MTRCYLFQELAITLAWPDYMQHFQELLMQKPWLKITSNSLELIFLALKSQNFQTTHHNLPKKSISLGENTVLIHLPWFYWHTLREELIHLIFIHLFNQSMTITFKKDTNPFKTSAISKFLHLLLIILKNVSIWLLLTLPISLLTHHTQVNHQAERTVQFSDCSKLIAGRDNQTSCQASQCSRNHCMYSLLQNKSLFCRITEQNCRHLH